jgi:hypothetical protein
MGIEKCAGTKKQRGGLGPVPLQCEVTTVYHNLMYIQKVRREDFVSCQYKHSKSWR